MNAHKILSTDKNNFGLILNILIVLNYIAWSFNFGAVLGPIIINLFFLFFIIFGVIVAVGDRERALVFLYCLSLLVFALGSRTTGWDTRTIWLFHAKRIYFDNTLYAQLDNYGSFSHNDYPVMVPALAASLGRLFDSWNEIFPKMSSGIALSAALVLICNFLSNSRKVVIFLFGLTLIFGYHKVDVGSYLTNGYMDPILALYTLLTVLLMNNLVERCNLSQNKKWVYNAFAFSIVGFILVLIKNEGFFLLISILVAYFISGGLKIKWRIIIATLVPISATLIWRYLVSKYGIVNDLAESNIFEKLNLRILDYNSWLLILTKIPIYFWLLVISYMYMKKYNISNFKELVARDAVIIFVSIYSLILIFVYITTRHDLAWHLETSIDRTILPLSTVLLYFIIYPQKQTVDAC